MAMIRPDPSLSPPSGENRDKIVMAMMVQRQGYRRRSNLPIFHFHGEGIDEVIQRSTWRKRR